MIFKGFEQKFPEYEVFLPQTLQTFRIRSITTSEELKLKTSLVGKQNQVDLLDKVLYDCIINKNESIETFEKFCQSITLKDREALFLGLYHCSYGDDVETPVICKYCEYEFDIKYKLSSGVKITQFDGNPLEFLEKRERVELDIAPAFITIKEPVLKDELDCLSNSLLLSEDDEFISLYLSVDKIEYYEGDDPSKLQEITDISDKIYALKSLVPMDRKKIKKSYADNFGKYNISLSYSTNCPKCRNQLYVGVDLMEEFFRQIFIG